MQPKRFYNKVAGSWAGRIKSDSKTRFLVRTFMFRNKQILDLGCGNGDLARAFANRGNSVLAVDSSERSLEYARKWNKHKNVEYVLSDFEEIRFDRLFDVVFAINSFVHVKDIPKQLVKIRSALNKKGLLILCIPHPMKDIGHAKNYSKESIITEKTKYGVIQQYHRSIGFYLNALADSGFSISSVHEFPLDNPLFLIIESRLSSVSV